MYQPKPLFLERMHELLTEENDFKNYLKSLETEPKVSIRCNTLKISPEDLKSRLESRSWIIKQPFKNNPEIFIIENNLQPGELGKTLEHQLGYYYVQETTSMMPVIVLNPEKNEIILDLAASPGSKTTQIAASMENTGTIIANDKDLGRISILAANLDRCGISNTIITKKDGVYLCGLLEKNNFLFDKIILDAPCSGEGTFCSAPKGMLMWNINTVKKLSKIQKNLITSAVKILKHNGILIYSTCTHSPEENEEIVDFAVKELNMKVEEFKLPLKTRKGITKWKNQEYSKDIEKCCRIYPQDNNTEGFFIAKLKKVN